MYLFIIITISVLFSESLTPEELKSLQNYKNSSYGSSEHFKVFDLIIKKEIDIENPVISILLYEACLFNDELTLANKYINMAISNDKTNQSYRDLSFNLEQYRDFLNRAKKTYEKDLVNEAIRDYLNIINTYPNRALPYYEQGIVYRSMKDMCSIFMIFNTCVFINLTVCITTNIVSLF